MRTVLFLALLAVAAHADEFLLRDGDRVVFLGDSITQQRLYTRYVQQYVYCRYPKRDIRFFNAGWGGDTAAGARSRLERDVLVLKPTVVTLFFGMNDGRYGAPDEKIREGFRTNLQELVRALKRRDIRVVVFTPGCVDPDRRPELRAYNETLRGLAAAALSVAREEGCPSADLHARMLAFQEVRKAENPEYTMIPDSVHPNQMGHRVMARWMLTALGAEAMVPLGRIDVRGGNAHGLRLADAGPAGFVLETTEPVASPFWINAAAAPTMRQCGFDAALVGRRLTVTGPGGAAYEVEINGVLCGKFDAAALANGVAVAGWGSAAGRAIHDLILRKEDLYFRTWREIRLPLQRQEGIDATVAALLEADEGLHRMIKTQTARRERLRIALVPAPAGANLAQERPYTCSDPNGYGWGAGGLTDGSWKADSKHCFATGNAAKFPKHVTVDLGAAKRVGSVRLGVPEFGSTRTVRVSLSLDGKRFDEVAVHEFRQTQAARQALAFAQRQARYVRLTYPDHHDEEVGYAPEFCFTTELEVYGAD